MILVNRKRIPTITNEESFIYLGKQFNFGMDIENVKKDLAEKNIKLCYQNWPITFVTVK